MTTNDKAMLANNVDPFHVVTTNPDGTIRRRLFKSTSYGRALDFISHRIAERPNLDMVQGGYFVAWEDRPLLTIPAVQGATSAPDRRRGRPKGPTTA